MQVNSKVFGFILLLSFIYSSSAGKCDKKIDRKLEADKCSKESTFFVNHATIPKTSEQTVEYCKTLNDNSQCVKKYGDDCLKGFPAQVMRIGWNGMKKIKNGICNKQTDRDAFTKNVKWVNKEKSEKLSDCLTRGIVNMEYIAKNVDSNEQIPQTCCCYWLFRQCFTRRLRENAPKTSNVNYIEKLMDNGSASMVEFLCSKQDSVGTCDRIMTDAMKRMNATFTAQTRGTTKLGSFLLPFLEVIVDN